MWRTLEGNCNFIVLIIAPTLSFGCVCKQTMSDKEKKRFQEMAERDKERFDSEMKNYEPTEPQGKGTKRKQIKDPNAPKRPLNAYFM